MENSNNQPLIYSKISAVMAEVPAIGKTKRNAQQGFNYRGIDDVMNALQNILPKHGVFYTPEVLSCNREDRVTKSGASMIYTTLQVRYTFYASDGSHVSAVVQSEGMDSADKSSNKAMSAACKYALFQVFNIPTEEMVDPDAVTPEPTVKTAPAEKPASAPRFDEATFLKGWTEIPGVGSMTRANAEAMADRNGNKYGDMDTERLFHMLNALQKKSRETGLSGEEKANVASKIAAVNEIFKVRKTALTIPGSVA